MTGPPLSQGLDDRAPLISGSRWPGPPLSQGLDDRAPPYLTLWIRHWLDIVSSLIKLVLVRFRSKLLYIISGCPSPTTAMVSPWHITPAFVFLSICFPFLTFYSSYTPLDPLPYPLSLFFFHLLSWAKPRNSLHGDSNYYYYYSSRHFLSFLSFQRMFSTFLTVWATTSFIRGWTLVKFEQKLNVCVTTRQGLGTPTF